MPTAESRILLATAGTWGDLLPFVELGRRLAARGHDVTLACSTGLRSWVERAGLKAAAFDGDFGKEQAQSHAKAWDHWDSAGKSNDDRSYAPLVDKLERNSRALSRLAADADLLLTASNCPEGRLAHELSGTPWISVIFIPEEGLRPAQADDERLADAMKELIQRLGLGIPFTTYSGLKKSSPALFACSEALGRASDPGIVQTGFWFYEDPRWTDWKPDSRLLDFMAEGDPPLVLSFSSLPLEDPAGVLEVHARAAALVGRKLVVQQGWAGFSPEQLPSDVDPERIYMAEFLPHDWFFSRASGLITHGGIGTLGRALRNSCPVLVEPYGNDQFYNALLVKRLGFGSAVHPHRLTPEGLARAIQDHLLTRKSRERSLEAAELIRAEDGVGRACALVEARLERSPEAT